MTNSLLKMVTSCLIDQLHQIESADGDQINEDFSINMMESVGAELQTLTSSDRSEFTRIISEMAACERGAGRKEYLEGFTENFGLD